MVGAASARGYAAASRARVSMIWIKGKTRPARQSMLEGYSFVTLAACVGQWRPLSLAAVLARTWTEGMHEVRGWADERRNRREHSADEAKPEKKLTKKEYEKTLAKLQIELVKLQEWVKDQGPEGRRGL